MKSWIADQFVCSKVMWLLMIHDFPHSFGLALEELMTRHHKKWLGLARMAEKNILYRHNSHFGLGFKSMDEIQNRLQLVRWLILKDSDDPKARLVFERRLDLDRKGHLGKGRRSSPCLDANRLDRRRILDGIAGTNNKGKQGVDLYFKSSRPSISAREETINLCKKEYEEKRIRLSLRYEMQTNWVRYSGLDDMERKDLTWKKMLSYQPNLLKWTLNATANTLPSPDNLRRWNQSKDACCGLCGAKHATLNHILAGCSWVNSFELKLPKSSRFKWRHDCVLAVIAKALREKVKSANVGKREILPYSICFVRAKEVPKKKKVPLRREHFLDAATDWMVLADLPAEHKQGRDFIFPQVVALTSYKPDVVIYSLSSKKCIVVELTSPVEENIEHWHKEKHAKYKKELVPNRNKGWTIELCIVEVGAKGWIPPSFTKDVKRCFGLEKNTLSLLVDECSKMARRCSYIIWLNRFNKAFDFWSTSVE
jgi:hypothetical protein